jgi:hypothetical protein
MTLQGGTKPAASEMNFRKSRVAGSDPSVAHTKGKWGSSMVSIRSHAIIDWLAVFGVELLGRLGPLNRRVRTLLKGSARLHAGYALATDYPLGLGFLPVSAHLAADMAVGAGLIGAGLIWRDEPQTMRMLLVGMGLTELLLVSLTRRAPGYRRRQA